MTDPQTPIQRKHLRLVGSSDMPERRTRELKIKRLTDVMHSPSTGMIAVMIEDERGKTDRIVMTGELAEKFHQMLGSTLAGARQNPAAP